jgi:hypothetical protein
MALAVTIALIAALVALRLFLPPVPGLLQTSVKRWGKRTTLTLCTVSLAVAALVILISRH